MGMPTYLALSRHNVCYLRWPLSEAPHPPVEQPQTTKKRGDRQPGRALRYAKGSSRGLLHHGSPHHPLTRGRPGPHRINVTEPRRGFKRGRPSVRAPP